MSPSLIARTPIVVLICLLLTNDHTQAGKLSSVRDNIRSLSKRSSKPRDSKERANNTDDEDRAASGTVAGIRAAVGDPGDQRIDHGRADQSCRRPRRQSRSPVNFIFSTLGCSEDSRHPPHFVEQHIYYRPTAAVEGDRPFEFFQPWQFRLDADYGPANNDSSRFGFGTLVQSPAGFGFDGGLRLFREEVPSGDRDHLWLGDLNFIFAPICRDRYQLRVGIGANFLSDSYGSNAGLNLTVGGDLFVTDWFAITSELDVGSLGDADLLHGRVTAGYSFDQHVECFAGYDYLDIGGVDINGFVAGLRFRF